MRQTLIKSKKYTGKYVALRSFTDSTVVAIGKTLKEAYKKALKKGYKNPVVTFVPPKNSVLIYPCN